jgi:hypothetical protein
MRSSARKQRDATRPCDPYLGDIPGQAVIRRTAITDYPSRRERMTLVLGVVGYIVTVVVIVANIFRILVAS